MKKNPADSAYNRKSEPVRGERKTRKPQGGKVKDGGIFGNWQPAKPSRRKEG